jgi:hypothetical protein
MWEVVFGLGKGQVYNHQKALEMVDTDLIWRIDDDNVPESHVLNKLVSHFHDSSTGAVGGLVLDPKFPSIPSSIATNDIKDVYLGLNTQWFRQTELCRADHLYSSFVYRKEAGKHGYCLELSPACHREETIFTYEMKRKGWDLWVDPSVITWHYRFSTGGIRSHKDRSCWDWDEQVFKRKLTEWGVTVNKYKLVVLDNGLGDHLAFNLILPELKEKYKDHKIILFVCYPEVFKDAGLVLGSIAETTVMGLNLSDLNIYKWMWDHNWKNSLVDAYRGLYL